MLIDTGTNRNRISAPTSLWAILSLYLCIIHQAVWLQQSGGALKMPGSGKKHKIEKSKEKKEGERRGHLDTISLSEGKHLRHSSQHTGL